MSDAALLMNPQSKIPSPHIEHMAAGFLISPARSELRKMPPNDSPSVFGPSPSPSRPAASSSDVNVASAQLQSVQGR